MSTSTPPLDSQALLDVLRDCAGLPLPGFEERAATTPFQDLGYDSLALLECAARLQTDHGIHVPDDVLFTLVTPEDLLILVNSTAREG